MTTFKTYSDLLNQFPNAQYNDIDFNTKTNEWIYNKQESATEIILLTLAAIVLLFIAFTIYNLC